MFPPIFNNAARKKQAGALNHNFCCSCALFASIAATAQMDLSSCAATQARSLEETLDSPTNMNEPSMQRAKWGCHALWRTLRNNEWVL